MGEEWEEKWEETREETREKTREETREETRDGIAWNGDEIQGIKVFHDISELPPTELAVLVIPAPMCPNTVKVLAETKEVKAFIIISAGFGEETEEGAKLEEEILETCRKHDCALIGPNCIGLLNNHHHSVFTKPIPQLNLRGVDFISGSGATAVFILESAVMKGLQFNSVWSRAKRERVGSVVSGEL